MLILSLELSSVFFVYTSGKKPAITVITVSKNTKSYKPYAMRTWMSLERTINTADINFFGSLFLTLMQVTSKLVSSMKKVIILDERIKCMPRTWLEFKDCVHTFSANINNISSFICKNQHLTKVLWPNIGKT